MKSDEEIKNYIRSALSEIAPEVDIAALDPQGALREQTDLDSMDFLNFIIKLHEVTGVSIPEADYPQVGTLNGLADYLRSRV